MTWTFLYYFKDQTEEKEHAVRREKEKILRRGHGCLEMPEILDLVSCWKFGLGIQEEGQDNKELLKTLMGGHLVGLVG